VSGPDLPGAAAILRATVGDRLRTDFPLAPLTTFRIGGPAALYLEPESEADLLAAGRAIVGGDVPLLVLGKGSNVLVADAGFPGLVLRLGRAFRWSARDGDVLTAGASMPLPALAGVALRHGLRGLEFGVAIPATTGGAVWMNAGAHGHDLAEVVETVELFRLREGRSVALPAAQAGFAYRRSSMGEDAVVIGARVRLAPGAASEIRVAMDGAREWRRATQPIAEPNCGSVFTNPEGDHAARLIEAAGAKGRRVGGAWVSPKHANFIVAGPGARAADVVRLIEEVRSLVAETSGIGLETEVRMVGSF
jgi:UDP-N-acetylmuramate dehydrogenase